MRNKNLKKMKKANKGITLIALVITIIVLLILAAVAISTLTGENGVLTKASDAKEQTTQEGEKEQIKLAYNATKMEKLGNGNTSAVVASELQKELDNQNAGAEAINEGRNIKVTFTESKNGYVINSVGTIWNEGEYREERIEFVLNDVTYFATKGDTWIDWLYDVKNSDGPEKFVSNVR